MKRSILAFVAVLLTALGGMAAMQQWEGATAQEERGIPVIARSDIFPGENTAPIGEPCRLIDQEAPGIRTPYQVVVTGPDGTVVTVHSLKGELALDDQGERRCIADAEIPVPDLGLYTVSLGDQRIIAYVADDFPISSDDTIQLFFD